MFKHLSLKIKTFILLILIVFLAAVPLSYYYLKMIKSISELGSDPAIETGLSKSIDVAQTLEEKQAAALALKKYRQINVLKSDIIRQVLIFSTVYGIFIILITLSLGYFFISRITRPLSNLTNATRQLAGDNLDYKIEDRAGGEIGILINSFNKMAGDLKIARQQRAIAERRATWQQVARTIAHEIKNPLTPIRLSTERMYDKYVNGSKDFPEVIKSTATTILNEIENLQKLVDTFHKYAKFPDPVLNPESVNTIIQNVLALFSGESVKIECLLKDNLPLLNLDKGQIHQALTNLLKNSVQAMEGTGRPGRIIIKSDIIDGKIQVSIEDNGCGISAENQKKLFQPYFTTKKHGNGIGLALTERIISLHGGSISVESMENEGTTFTISFSAGG